MNKNEFLSELEKRLNGLPKEDINNRIMFYGEMIDDRVDEGKSEEEAIADLGGIDNVVNEIAKDTPLFKLVKEKVKPKKKMSGLTIALLILGFPLWFPLLITFFVLCFVGYILLWTFVIVSLSLFVASLGAGIVFFIMAFVNDFNIGYLAISFIALGLSPVFYILLKYMLKATIAVSKKIVLNIKSKLIRG